jgi:phage gpG-like protein
MIRLTFNGSDKKVVDMVRKKGPQLVVAITDKINELMLQLQQHIVRDKLSGQVLHHRSGKLAGSIVNLPVVAKGAQLIGEVVGAGGPAWYGKVHEFGPTTIVPKTKKYLRFKIGDHWITKSKVVIPSRPFMGPSLEDMRLKIIDEIQLTVKTVIERR